MKDVMVTLNDFGNNNDIITSLGGAIMAEILWARNKQRLHEEHVEHTHNTKHDRIVRVLRVG